jgi:hypothetical protein
MASGGTPRGDSRDSGLVRHDDSVAQYSRQAIEVVEYCLVVVSDAWTSGQSKQRWYVVERSCMQRGSDVLALFSHESRVRRNGCDGIGQSAEGKDGREECASAELP